MRLGLLLSALLLLPMLTARAAPPANDQYADAIDLGSTLPVTLAGTCAEATLEAGESNFPYSLSLGAIHSTVWWRWTAPADGWVGAALPNGVVIAAYQDGPGVPDQSRLLLNHQTTGSSVRPFRVTAGQVLRLQVSAAYNTAAGSFSFTLNTMPPPNDGPENGGYAELPRQPSLTLASSNFGATVAPQEALPPGANTGSTVYFLLFSYGPFPCEISTAGSTLDTVLAVYTYGQTTLLDWNDDAAPGDYSSRVTFTPSGSGQYYVVQVGGWDGTQGSFQLSVKYALPPAPANDARAAAVELSGSLPQSWPVQTFSATREADEVTPGGMRRTLWYRWRAPEAGTYKLDGTFTLGNESPSFCVCRYVPGLPATADVITHGLPSVFRAGAGETFLISVAGRLGYAGYEIASTISLMQTVAQATATFDDTAAGPLRHQGSVANGWSGPWYYDDSRDERGAWFSPSEEGNSFSAVSTAGSLGSDGGRRITVAAVDGTVSLSRPLAFAPGNNNTVTYFSFLLSTESTAANAYAGVRLITSGGPMIFIGKPGAGETGKWVIEDVGGAGQQSFQSSDIVPGRAARLVVRADFGVTDEFKLYTDVAPDMPEYYYRPSIKTGDYHSILDLGLFSIAACQLDDLRMGSTWESVTQPEADAPVIFNEAFTSAAWDFNGDGLASKTDDAYCELVNRNDAMQDLSGQSVWRGPLYLHTFPAGTVLQPRQALVLFGGGNIAEGATGALGQAWVQRASGGHGIGEGFYPLTLHSTAASGAAVLASFTYYHFFFPTTRWPELTGSAWQAFQHQNTGFVPGGAPGSPGRRVNLTPWLPLTQALTVSISRGSVVEGAGWNAASVTISRPGPLTGQLTLQLRSDASSLVSVADTAVLPVGEAAITLPLSIQQDFLAAGDRTVTLTAIGSGFLNGVASLTVLDNDRRIYINEINAQSNTGGGGPDFGEFIELYDGGIGNKPLHDFIVVLFDADAPDNGAYRVIDLQGRMTNSSGLLLIDGVSFPELTSGWLTNSSGAVAIYKKPAGGGGGGGGGGFFAPYYNFPPGTPPVVNADLIDAITHVTDDAPDLALVALFTPGGVQADEGPAPNPPATFINFSTARCPDARAPFDSGAFRQFTPTPGSSNLTYPGFTSWASTRGVTSMTADEDNDGLDNLLEYALGGVPLSPEGENPNSILLIPEPLDNPFGELRLFVRKGPQAGFDPRLRWDVEASADLLHWTTRDVVIVQEDCATLTAAYTGATSRVQMRLRVSNQP